MDKTTTYCDIEGCGKESEYMRPRRDMQIIMTTETDEGHKCDPYIVHLDIDICQTCYAKILLGAAIFGEGAQGHNKYHMGVCG